ncbi:MAG: hypothetical protein F4103_16535 [Boseongicola sp. SB0673_bin_14]|nr:hypothetical protein [Boseongicola sp. SB0673_bin_14]
MTAWAGDCVLAWRILRRTGEYREAWDRFAADHAPAPDEPGPFRIRVQARADLDAGRFGLLAWEDPRREDGPASPFWRQDGMLEGLADPAARPPAALDGGGSVEGLRLLSGGLVVKVECRGAAVQVLVAGGDPFPDGAGLSVRHAFGLRMPPTVGRLVGFWSVAGRSRPREGPGVSRHGTS